MADPGKQPPQTGFQDQQQQPTAGYQYQVPINQPPPMYNNYDQTSSAYGPNVGINVRARSDSADPIYREWVTEGSGLFAEKGIRQAFVRKVYSILSIQLIATSILIAVFVLTPEIKAYFKLHRGWQFVGLMFMIIPYFMFICCETARRKTPQNFILLAVLTAGYGFEAAVISCRYNTTTIMSAFLATGISCVLIASFAKSTKFDITDCGMTLCLLVFGHFLMALLIIPIFIMADIPKVGLTLLAILGAFLISLYLMYDIQLIMGGHKLELSPEEYILGAVMLYVDIIQMFLFMLRILSDD